MMSVFSIRTVPGLLLGLLLAGFFLAPGAVSGQEADEAPAAEPEAPQLKSLSDKEVRTLDGLIADIESNLIIIDDLNKRVGKVEGLTRDVLLERMDRRWMATLNLAISFSTEVLKKRDDGFAVDSYVAQVEKLLDELPAAVKEAVDRIGMRVVTPDASASAAEQAAIDERFFAALGSVTETYEIMEDAIDIAKKFGIDPSEEEEFLRDELTDAVTNLSVFLDITQSTAAGLRSGAALIPDDPELAAKLAVTNVRVRRIANSLQAAIAVLEPLGVSTSEYKQQLLTVTGEITASVLDWDVVKGLVDAWWQVVVDFFFERGPSFLVQLFIFFSIIYVATKVGGLLQKGIKKGFAKSGNHFSVLLQSMVLSISRNIVVMLGVLIALSQIGISLAPLLTGLGIVGFIVGFALQDSLSNFASGMMILFYRPFDVGDTIEVVGARGKVSSMSLVNTTIRTFDNQSLIIPNNKVWQDVITNVTDQRQRRIDMSFGIMYDEDIDRVEKVLMDVVTADERILKDPAPMVKVGAFGDSAVEILVRPWVKTDEYWDVRWDLNKVIKQAFDRENIAIPFPQRDIHVFQQQATAGSADGSPDVSAK
jgi:small conductance mechanosensitive channel